MTDNVLTIDDLETHYETDTDSVRAVDGVSLTVERGEIVGLVGESGCGKSTLAHSIMQTVEKPGRIVSGSVTLGDRDLTELDFDSLQEIRGEDLSIIFQNPMEALNPVYTIGTQIAEVILNHDDDATKATARAEAADLLEAVNIPDPEEAVDRYPHEFSGGMQQRAVIAAAIARTPDLIIADEPTTALDVTTERAILELLTDICEEYDVAILLITHDLGVVAETCDRVNVMYAGEVVERGPVESVFTEPAHPYTRGLVGSIPRLDGPRDRLSSIDGTVPNMRDPPRGCRFHPRCPHADEGCREESPPSHHVGSDGDHRANCVLYGDGFTLPFERSLVGPDLGASESPSTDPGHRGGGQ